MKSASKHCRMIFRFSGMDRAYKFEYALKRFGLAGAAIHSDELGWHVVTDSRCLEHAAQLSTYIYGGAQ